MKVSLCFSLLLLLEGIGLKPSFSADNNLSLLSIGELRNKVLPLDREIKAIIGAAACANDNECRVIGYGAKPCGGPGGYLSYSEKNTNVTLLEQKVSEFNALGRELNRRTDIMSDCMVVPKPRVSCIENRCVTK
jgi:hypothetical protein